MFHLDLIKPTALMERTSGSPEIKIGLIDGPIAAQHSDLAIVAAIKAGLEISGGLESDVQTILKNLDTYHKTALAAPVQFEKKNAKWTR